MPFPAELHSPSFSEEQKRYLEGFFAGIAQRGATPYVAQTADGRLTNDAASALPNEAAEECVFGTPVSELCKEERWKHEENALDIWDKLLAHANENRVPASDDLFRFKYHGLFHVAPAQDSFMLRLRAAGGMLTAEQMRGLARMAVEWGCGSADLTTRANLQLREFQPREIVQVLNRVQSLGLTSRGSGADNIRNITASPISGVDPHELMDVAPLAEAMHFYILNSRDMYGLPRKFNIAFDGGGSIGVVADTNDIAFCAVEVTEGREVPAGIYFRVALGGITGHGQFASDAGLLLRADQAVAVAAAMVRVFAENGDRTDRKKARLKYLLDRWGVERFLAETEKRLAFPLLRFPLAECEPRRMIDRGAHIGVHAQRQAEKNYIGVAVPVGRVTAEQMTALADVAERYGSGELRLTVWQNVILPNVAGSDTEVAVKALADAGLSVVAGTVTSGTVACTGNKGCRYSACDTKAHAVALATRLDSRFRIEQPVNLHVTGCPHSCAQHSIGDIGLLGMKIGGAEGYQVVLGGGSDDAQGLARELISAIRFEELPPVMERLFAAYVERRVEGESFLAFSRRHEIDALQAMCAERVSE